MKSSPDDPANTRSNGPNLVSGTLRLVDGPRFAWEEAQCWGARSITPDEVVENVADAEQSDRVLARSEQAEDREQQQPALPDVARFHRCATPDVFAR